jgi:hypothetical protein
MVPASPGLGGMKLETRERKKKKKKKQKTKNNNKKNNNKKKKKKEKETRSLQVRRADTRSAPGRVTIYAKPFGCLGRTPAARLSRGLGSVTASQK